MGLEKQITVPVAGCGRFAAASQRTGFGMVELHSFKSELCVIPDGMRVEPRDFVVYQDDDGEDLGRMVSFCAGGDVGGRLLRVATEDDLRVRADLDTRTMRVMELFCRLKDEFRLNMQVVGAHWRFDRRKVCFYFVSEERLDFRGLHKSVSSALNVRVAIKQIGVRDYARVLGGIGACGLEVCCRRFLKEMRPIALRMARQQNLFVEPAKISGLCGKLLCCLSYEEETYRELILSMPHSGSRVRTARGVGTVTGVDVLTRRAQVRFDDGIELVVAVEDITLDTESDATIET